MAKKKITIVVTEKLHKKFKNSVKKKKLSLQTRLVELIENDLKV